MNQSYNAGALVERVKLVLGTTRAKCRRLDRHYTGLGDMLRISPSELHKTAACRRWELVEGAGGGHIPLKLSRR
jgi:hypothetical protein